jgi:hypothetical protein
MYFRSHRPFGFMNFNIYIISFKWSSMFAINWETWFMKDVPHNIENIFSNNHWFILFSHVWGSAWIKIHWNSIWLRAMSHMASHYTWGSVTPLHDFEGVLGRPLDTFFWALTISCSRLLAHVWSGPKVPPLSFLGEGATHEINVGAYNP